MKIHFKSIASVALSVALVTTAFVTTPATAATKNLTIETVFQLTPPDPGRTFEQTGNMINHAMYQTLVTYKGGDASTPVASIASKWSVNAGATQFTFTIDPKAKFSDGTKVTSADVLFSLNRVKNIKGNPSSLMAGITVAAPDASTVVLTTEKATPQVLAIVTSPSLGIVNSKVVKANGGSDAEDASTSDKALAYLTSASAGSGPYMLKSFSLTTEVDLVKNPNFWGADKPAYDKIIFRNVPVNVQRLDIIKGSSSIAIDLSPDQASGVGNKVNVIKGQASNVFFFYLSQNSAFSAATKFTSNPKCVEAVRYGINYNKIVRYAGLGAIQAPGIIPSFFSGALTQKDAIKQDTARAKAAFDACGIKDTPVSISFWGSGGAVNGLNFGSLAALVNEDLNAVGFNTSLTGAPISVSLPLYRDNKEEMGLWLWGPDWPDSTNYTESFSPGTKVGLRMGWPAGADAAITALQAKAATETDAKKRAALFTQWQKEMNLRSPLIPLVQPADILVANKSVLNVKDHPIWKLNLTELK
ncbi:MAG: ABC transporter substrate-binding protein [Actinobacteria bacterium]|nr:ABC transporter substrate-binding protein [Actinomycetota bacterium]